MHELMSCKTKLNKECIITYFKAIQVLTSMYVCILYQTTLVTESLITHIKKHKGVYQCVCWYALSDYFCI